jgi:hypothetical protein
MMPSAALHPQNGYTALELTADDAICALLRNPITTQAEVCQGTVAPALQNSGASSGCCVLS